MRKVFILIILSMFPLHLCQANTKIEIKYKIGEEIVTNLDILDEKKYLVFLKQLIIKSKSELILNLVSNIILFFF